MKVLHPLTQHLILSRMRPLHHSWNSSVINCSLRVFPPLPLLTPPHPQTSLIKKQRFLVIKAAAYQDKIRPSFYQIALWVGRKVYKSRAAGEEFLQRNGMCSLRVLATNQTLLPESLGDSLGSYRQEKKSQEIKSQTSHILLPFFYRWLGGS